MKLTLLDRVNLGRIWLQTVHREYFRWKNTNVGQPGIRTFYGFDHIPETHEKAFGGIVKVQDLQKNYPNNPHNANILYLVSSCLPEFAVRMARFAKKAGVKVVLNQNGVAYPGWHGKGWERVNRPMSQILHLSDYIIYQSEFCKMAADRFLGESDKSNEVLYNPVDTKVFRPDDKALSDHNNGVKLLLAGSHQSFYRVKVALEAFKLVLQKFPEARLIIAGRCTWERDEKSALRQLREFMADVALEDFVDITGPYTQAQAPAVFCQAHILLHTKYNDPCPRLVVEAMACGLPVVYSATGGVPELVGSEAGRGVSAPLDWEKDHPPDFSVFAEEIIRVVSQRKEYGIAARKRAVEHFDVQPWLMRHGQVFTQLLEF